MVRRATVVRSTNFEAAHFLPYYIGDCRNMHGHHFVVDLGISGEVETDVLSLPTKGMVIDFRILSKWLKEAVKDAFDHGVINNTIENPTAENIGWFVFSRILVLLDEQEHLQQNGESLKLEFVRVHEGPNSYVEVKD